MGAYAHSKGPRGAILSRRLSERPTPVKHHHASQASDEDLLAMARILLTRARRARATQDVANISEAVRGLEEAVHGRRAG